MKAKVILVVCLVAIAGYTVYNSYMTGGPETDEKNVRTSFNSMTLSIASKSKVAVQTFLSPTFSDRKVTRDDLVKILTMNRDQYSAKIESIKTKGDLASIFYTRTESRGEDNQAVTTKIAGETWIRDGKNPVMWRLHKLAPNDRWFRVAELPKKIKKAVATKNGSDEPGGAEKSRFKFASLKAGEKYSPAGKRDPFKSLIAFELDLGSNLPEVCDQGRPRDLLEGYDLASLKLSGVIQVAGGSLALIETPDGKGYTVRPGMYLGKSCGKIKEIERHFVIVEEQIRETGVRGVYFNTVETSIKLRPEEG
ncbi:hypothetical protein MNBD_NITROSPINAE02-858 [hydrothermal vent metagenome]|uniref:Type IV pilus biogenesis protein PilP n=1 Tax=hydrothermal vent metagenome TaxID=652676 RepID=A0A3B1CES6_9ZZZZ